MSDLSTLRAPKAAALQGIMPAIQLSFCSLSASVQPWTELWRVRFFGGSVF